jgi:CheY-like chemotaxis protein
LQRAFNHYYTVCYDKQLEIFLEIPDHTENLTVNSDPEILQRIIYHLLNNAVKFTEKGNIHFGYKIYENEFEFFVKDTGIGIMKESVIKIFDRFEKVDHGPSRITEGSGLGLSISKGMSDLIDGNLKVESEIGVGSCFSFTVPVLNSTGETITETRGSRDMMKVARPKILVAEDDETSFFFLEAILSHESQATVIHAANGRETVELFKSEPDIILILMDMKMPEVDGFEATRQIKLLKRNVPVIAITAYAMSGDEAKILSAGCDGYLSKPIGKQSLMDKIAEFVKI